jgi:hypothetical protein
MAIDIGIVIIIRNLENSYITRSMIMPAGDTAVRKRKAPASRVALKTYFADGDHICQVDQEYANNCRF